MSFSAAQVDTVRSNWCSMTADIDAAGYRIFELLFQRNPDYQSKFKAFKGLAVSALKGNPNAEKHIRIVLGGLGRILGALNTPELDVIYKEMASNHKPRGVMKQQFKDMGQAIVTALSEIQSKSGGSFDRATWEALFESVANGIGQYQ
uniref:Globin n=1 Tax=Aequiyoldia eightsii TaxID=2716527 RepID=GLB_AEQEI|nr:RecName: Full=Globin [Aequiyoldia eightsii]AAM00251.1 hemoglobin [Aequiyoldia eightsii]